MSTIEAVAKNLETNKRLLVHISSKYKDDKSKAKIAADNAIKEIKEDIQKFETYLSKAQNLPETEAIKLFEKMCG